MSVDEINERIRAALTYNEYEYKKKNSTENDSFYCYFDNATDVVTKLCFATEVIYQKHLREKRPDSKDGRTSVPRK